jgi:hypothetical protein
VATVKLLKKIRKRSASWLAKSARRGFRGYPIATVALYGPTADLATKIAVSIIPDERKPPDVLERWFSEDIDVRHDPVVGEQTQAFLRFAGTAGCVGIDHYYSGGITRAHGLLS